MPALGPIDHLAKLHQHIRPRALRPRLFRLSSDLAIQPRDIAPDHRTGQIVDRQNKTVFRHEARERAQRHPAMALSISARGGMMMSESVGQQHRDVRRQPEPAQIVTLCDPAPAVTEDDDSIGRLVQNDWWRSHEAPVDTLALNGHRGSARHTDSRCCRRGPAHSTRRTAGRSPCSGSNCDPAGSARSSAG